MKERQKLFNHLADEHNLILVESEIQEITNIILDDFGLWVKKNKAGYHYNDVHNTIENYLTEG